MLSVLSLAFANLFYLALHITNSGSFPRPLSAAEERHYLELLKSGDTAAKNILIERNLRLVAHIIKKYYSNAKDQDDLISIGTIGLIKAVSTFDGEKGTRLATYAARCIENAMRSLRLSRASGMRFSANTAAPHCRRNPDAHAGARPVNHSAACIFLPGSGGEIRLIPGHS